MDAREFLIDHHLLRTRAGRYCSCGLQSPGESHVEHVVRAALEHGERRLEEAMREVVGDAT